jgi:hypothetical protein
VSKFVPNGYITIPEALDRIGRELFSSEWTGEEQTARRGLISREEWLKAKDLPPARGGGAPGAEARLGSPATATRSSNDDPSSPAYQAEYRMGERYAAAHHRLRVRLESGDLEAAIFDPFTGRMHLAPVSLWRRHDADRMIQKGQAPIPHSPNKGRLLIKQVAEASGPAKAMPPAKIREAIDVLKAKIATETLTRAQQADFVRKRFPTYRVTERQLREIFAEVKVLTGRPTKSDKQL